MRELKIGNLTAKTPIIQGGMGVGVSLDSLAAAVANEGGIGTISAAGAGFDLPEYKENPEETSAKALRRLIRGARAKTDGIIAVNIMVALSNYELFVKTAIEERIDIIFSGAGLPLDLLKFLTDSAKTKLVPIVSSLRAANIITKKWRGKYNYIPDAFVVEGFLAGGHLGFKKEQISDENYRLEKIIPEVVEFANKIGEENDKSIPVIAAGGIFTGQDIKRFMDLGASGVQMGTRFVATVECDASDEFKSAYVNCGKDNLTIIDSPVGMPGRAIRNKFLQDVNEGLKKPINCPYHCIKTCNVKESSYCIARALLNAKTGDIKNGFAFAGANAYRINEITTVHNLIEMLKDEYNSAEMELFTKNCV